MSDTPPRRPVPVPDEQSQGFWQAAATHQLAVQRCTHCGWLSYPPDLVCMNCLSPRPSFRWDPVSGQGQLRSWAIVHTAFLPGFAAVVPYVVATAELDAQPGLQMAVRLLDGPEAVLTRKAGVETVFEDVAEALSIPAFRLIGR